MSASRGLMARGVAALGAAAILLSPALAAAPKAAKRGAKSISLSAPGSLGSFTPAAANPRMAAALARGGASVSREFRFTPSATPGSRRAVRVAVRTRANSKAEAERAVTAGAGAANVGSITPTAYNLGVSIGWKQFALSGDVAKVEGNLLGGDRESVDVGLAYLGSKWSTRLNLGADRATGSQPTLIGGDQGYSVDLGGSYSLSRSLAVTGGLRYRLQRENLLPLLDERRDSQAVYVGTAFKF